MKRQFHISDNVADRGDSPLVLIDDTGTVVRVGDRSQVLAEIALCELGADEVIHQDQRWELE